MRRRKWSCGSRNFNCVAGSAAGAHPAAMNSAALSFSGSSCLVRAGGEILRQCQDDSTRRGDFSGGTGVSGARAGDSRRGEGVSAGGGGVCGDGAGGSGSSHGDFFRGTGVSGPVEKDLLWGGGALGCREKIFSGAGESSLPQKEIRPAAGESPCRRQKILPAAGEFPLRGEKIFPAARRFRPAGNSFSRRGAVSSATEKDSAHGPGPACSPIKDFSCRRGVSGAAERDLSRPSGGWFPAAGGRADCFSHPNPRPHHACLG